MKLRRRWKNRSRHDGMGISTMLKHSNRTKQYTKEDNQAVFENWALVVLEMTRTGNSLLGVSIGGGHLAGKPVTPVCIDGCRCCSHRWGRGRSSDFSSSGSSFAIFPGLYVLSCREYARERELRPHGIGFARFPMCAQQTVIQGSRSSHSRE